MGVHLFGFSDDGELGGHNFDIPKDANELHALLVRYWYELMRIGKEKLEEPQEKPGRARLSCGKRYLHCH